MLCCDFLIFKYILCFITYLKANKTKTNLEISLRFLTKK